MRKLLTHISLPFTLLLWLLLALPRMAGAQGRFYYASGIYEPEWLIEGGVTAGIMNAVSDIGGNPNVYQGPFAGTTFKKSKFTAGVYGGIVWRDYIGVRAEINIGSVMGADSLIPNPKASSAIGRYERNLNFRSPIYEFGLVSDWYLLNMLRSYDKPPRRFEPYVLAGLQFFKFNPQGYVGDDWIDLRPLRLEGQGFAEYPDRKIYSLINFAYGLGLGVRYDVSPKWTLRAEFNKRTTFTDYLDDAHEPSWVDPSLFPNYLSPENAALAAQLYNRSTIINPPRDTRPRAHPTENDAYWSLALKVGYNFNRGDDFTPFGNRRNRGGMMKRLRCPNF